MWNRDIKASTTPHMLVSLYFDCDRETANRIILDCADRETDGTEGKPFVLTIADVAAEYPTVFDQVELLRVFADAWSDGITAKDRVAVALDSETEGCCDDCGRSVPHHDAVCDYCGSEKVTRFVMATVTDKHAETWADADRYIDGDTWESDGSGRSVYARLIDRETLVDDLHAEGYRLNLANYT